MMWPAMPSRTQVVGVQASAARTSPMAPSLLKVFVVATVVSPMSVLRRSWVRKLRSRKLLTVNPAKMHNYPDKIGTLTPGVNADVAVLELAQGNFELRDSRGQTRTARQQFVNIATVKSGIFVKGAPEASS